MLNLYENIRTEKHYNKFQIGEMLFAEYTCPIEEESVSIWTHTDYIVHVISGKKIWHTTDGSWNAEAGQTLFFKKGAAIIDQFFDAEFCLFLFFIPDNFIREILKEIGDEIISTPLLVSTQDSAIRVNNDVALSAFFQSMQIYFSAAKKPSPSLLKLKLKELILSILLSKSNPALTSYFLSLGKMTVPIISEIMEANFRYNLSLENFAELCHRSLSSFKRDFEKLYRETPGRWLLKKRLEYAAVLLRNETMNISQIIFECGFEDLSHFSKVFKEKYGISPTDFRKKRQRL